ncbi:MAG TPA: hypothetical protein VEX18_19135 [Polyangiaceae bacterium]|nr:hypothetical protein [Polyangiaceae bacterium]
MAQDLEGVADAYKAPLMDYEEAPVRAEGSAAVYVVAPTKFMILAFSTMGMYSLYWFYKNWSLQRHAYGLNIWPVPRAIFAVFFTHQLFRAIDTQAHERGYAPGWNANGQATLYVGLAVASYITGRFNDAANVGTALVLLSLGLALAGTVPLFAAQKVANLVAGDVEGRSNASITAANAAVILIGLLLWTTVGAGVFLGAAGTQ